jgi:hypothetical protein
MIYSKTPFIFIVSFSDMFDDLLKNIINSIIYYFKFTPG